jgi:hypothetical protein
MPVIYIEDIRKYIKRHVIFFSKLILKSIIDICLILVHRSPYFMTFFEIIEAIIFRPKSYLLVHCIACRPVYLTHFCSSHRNYSTSRGSGVHKLENKRKTLASPKSKPYEDLYAGRGRPENEPV